MSGSVNFASDKGKRKLGTAAMLGASFCFSLGGLLIKLIPWNPLAINGVRNLIASAVIGCFLIVTRHRLKMNLTVLAGAVCMAGVTTFYTIANKLTSAGNAIVLQYTAPIWIIVLMYLFFGKKPGKREVTAIGIVLAGIVCFFFEGLTTGKIAGDLTALLSGFFYAGVFMLNSFEKGDALSSMFFGQLLCGICLSPFVLGETVFTLPVLAAVFVLGTVQVGLAYILFSVGTAYTDPVTASILNAVEPILNPILVAVFYGERLGMLSVIGAAVVIGGVLFYNLTGLKSENKKTSDRN